MAIYSNNGGKILLVALSIILLLWTLYSVLGHGIFYNIISFENIHPVESYYEVVDNLVLGSFLLIVTILLIFFLVFDSNYIKSWNSNHYFIFAGIISCLFLSGLLLHGQTNIEDYQLLITSALIKFKYLFNGKILYWYDGRGFGMPFPPTQTPDTHPIFMLAQYFSLRFVYSFYWVFHLSFGCFFFIKLCRLLGLEKPLALISGFLFAFSMPTINYAIYDDFSNIFFMWTMYPLIVYLSFKVILDKSDRINYRVFLLPIIIAITALNSLASVYMHYLLILAICLIFASLQPFKPRKIMLLLFVFLVTCILVSPRIYYTLNELSFFPDGLIGHAQKSFSIGGVLSHNMVPFDLEFWRDIWHGSESSNIRSATSKGISKLLFHKPRTSFIGFIYLVLAISSVASLWRYFFKDSTDLSLIRAAVSVGFICGFLGMLTDTSVFYDTVSPWTMRDEMIFFGIISAGIQLQGLKRGLLRNHPGFVSLLLIVQILQLLAYTSYLVYYSKGDSYFYSQKKKYVTNFFQKPIQGDKLYDWLTENKKKYGNRILLSPLIEKDLNMEIPILGKEKFYSIADINLHVGLNVINTSGQRGISMNRIYSSKVFTQGQIYTNYDVLENSELLNVAGINWVLIKKDELDSNGPFLNLVEKEYFQFSWKDESWVLLHNENAWSKAFMLSDGVLDNPPSYREQCGHTGFLCAEMELYLPYKKDIIIQRTGGNGHVQLSFAPQNENTILGLSTMYRPEWTAYADKEQLIIKPLFDAFIGIEVPPGVTRISLYFNPKMRIWLIYFSMVTFVACVGGIVFLAKRDKSNLKEDL